MNYTKARLKERGWTNASIKRFLGDPDATSINPHYRSGPPVCLYDAERVHAAEQTAEYVAFQRGRSRRRAAAKKAVRTKRQATRAYVDSLAVQVPRLAPHVLRRDALSHYEARTGRLPVDADEEFLARISVNYLRHELTPYEQALEETEGKVGVGDAYFTLKGKVLRAIADAYPDLGPECERQRSELLSGCRGTDFTRPLKSLPSRP